LSETFFILRSTERCIIANYIGLHLKYPLLLSDFNDTWILPSFLKILKYQNS